MGFGVLVLSSLDHTISFNKFGLIYLSKYDFKDINIQQIFTLLRINKLKKLFAHPKVSVLKHLKLVSLSKFHNRVDKIKIDRF